MSSTSKLFSKRNYSTVCALAQQALRMTALAIIMMLSPGTASAQTVDWVRQFGTAANDDALAAAADATSAYAAGAVSSGAALPGQSSAGGQDAYVRKYNTSGAEQWSRQFGTAGSDSALGVAVDATGVYVAGVTAGTLAGQGSAGGMDAFVRKYDATGTVLWTRQFGSNDSDAALAVVSDGSSVYVVGYTLGTFPGQTSSGEEDAFIRKYDTAGNLVWTRQFGSSGSETDTAAALDSSGIYVSGTTTGALPGQTDGPFADAYVRKYDTGGNIVWTQQFSSTGSLASDSAFGVAVDASGVYVGGATLGTFQGQTSTGGEDAFVRKFDLGGGVLWTRQFGNTQTATFSGATAVATGGGGVHVAGTTSGALPGKTNAGEEDFYVRKYDISGTELWTAQLGSDNSDFVYGVAANSTGVFVAGETFGILSGQSGVGQQDAVLFRLTSPTVCSYSIAPQNQAFAAAGGPGTVTVAAATGCPWTATSNSPFVSVTSGATGSGNGTVNISVAANGTTASRSGTVTIAGLTFTVDQAGTDCSYILTPVSQSFAAAGGPGSVTVTTQGNCPWTATSNAAFVNISSSSSGSGTGTLNFTVAVNSTTTPRSGTLTIAGQTFTANQAAAVCGYTIEPTSQSVPAAGGTGIISLTSPDGCPWNATSNSSFITITSGASGTGNGSIGYSVAANAGSSSRNGTITAGGQTFTVTQSAPAGPDIFSGGILNNASYALDPAPKAAGSIVAIFGANLNNGSSNPNPLLDSNNKVLTTLGGASVTFNGFAAPMFYSFPGQLGAQIPYEVAGQTTVSVVVTVGGQSSAPRTIFIDTAAPGLFTLNQQGSGQGAILIGGLSTAVLAAPGVNNFGIASRPARRGEVITIFCTGLGVVNPPAATGVLAGVGETTPRATVTIDGLPAVVQYSGTAPGFVGLNQINAVVPNGARFADDITITVSQNGKLSNTATIAVGP